MADWTVCESEGGRCIESFVTCTDSRQDYNYDCMAKNTNTPVCCAECRY